MSKFKELRAVWRIYLAFKKAKEDKKLSLREIISLVELACTELSIDMDKTGVEFKGEVNGQ